MWAVHIQFQLNTVWSAMTMQEGHVQIWLIVVCKTKETLEGHAQHQLTVVQEKFSGGKHCLMSFYHCL